MCVAKTCTANPTSSYPSCYALYISTELLKLVDCVVLALDLQRGLRITVRSHRTKYGELNQPIVARTNVAKLNRILCNAMEPYILGLIIQRDGFTAHY